MSRPVVRAFVGFAGLAGWLALAAAAPSGADELFRVEEARAGQRGYGVSVFAGSEPRRFEVEVVGVLRNVAPGMSYLLARLSGENLENTGVIAGMSGSPVWIDGRLAGAVSFGFAFGKEPIAGITPIAAMRAIPSGSASSPATVGGAPAAAALLPLAELAALRIPPDLLDRQLAALARLGSAPPSGSPALLWAASGFSAPALARLGGALSPLGTFGAGGSGAPATALEPGSAVAGLLVDGDLQLAATGTVTERRGDELVAFGHPFLGLGASTIPMASAEIVGVVASQMTSFKLANSGPVVGSIVFDQTAGVRGRIGVIPRQVPLTVRIGGPAARSVSVRLADVPTLLPSLTAVATLGSLEAAAATAAQSVDAELRVQLSGGRRLRMRQSFDGLGSASDLVGWLLAVSSYLTLNPLESTSFERLELDLEPGGAPRVASLVAVRPERAVVRRGETLGLEVTTLPYRGEPVRRRVEILLPDDLNPGRYSLLVGDGASIEGARLEIEPSIPTTLDQALSLLGDLATRREIVVLGVAPARGVVAPGETLTRLPGTVQSLRGLVAGRVDQRPLRLAVLQRVRFELDTPLAGMARVELEVRGTGVVAGKEKP